MPTLPLLRRSTRDRKSNPKYAANVFTSGSFALYVTEPTCFEEAAEVTEWHDAMIEEIRAIEHSQTWELVDLLEDKTPIGLKWVFKLKYHADGSIKKYKVRLVAKGYAQHQGINFDETFSPAAHFETMRTLLSLAAILKLPVYQFDVKSAFLNVELEEEVYVSQPEGFVVKIVRTRFTGF